MPSTSPLHHYNKVTVKHILFVCIENSCRSQIAQAYAIKLGGNKLTAYSSGSRPSGVVNAKAIASMQRDGYDLSQHQSKSLNDIPVIEYDYAITMGCGDECPNVQAKVRLDWNIEDPKHMNKQDFDAIRDVIKNKIAALLYT